MYKTAPNSSRAGFSRSILSIRVAIQQQAPGLSAGHWRCLCAL